jgi:hypothetical protein
MQLSIGSLQLELIPSEERSEGCANCGTQENLKKCGRCRLIKFCSLKCQQTAWKTHSLDCKDNDFGNPEKINYYIKGKNGFYCDKKSGMRNFWQINKRTDELTEQYKNLYQAMTKKMLDVNLVEFIEKKKTEEKKKKE